MLSNSSMIRSAKMAAPTLTRGMATLAELKNRIRSVNSIAKITKAMKMVAASKLRAAQANVTISRCFQSGVVPAWPQPAEKDAVPKADAPFLLAALTSDRGLCGSVNTTIVRDVKSKIKSHVAAKKNLNIVLFGDKARSGLERAYSQYFTYSFAELGRVKRATFQQILRVTDAFNKLKFDQGEFVYNYFRSVMTFEPTTVKLYSLDTLTNKTNIGEKYENEGGDELLQNFYEFRHAVMFFHMFAESQASELSSRMNAMGASSKNATDMLVKLNVKYNRTRQAKITNELIEIISGASAAEEVEKAAKNK